MTLGDLVGVGARPSFVWPDWTIPIGRQHNRVEISLGEESCLRRCLHLNRTSLMPTARRGDRACLGLSRRFRAEISPHPNAVARFKAIEGLSEAVKRNIPSDNPKRFYGVVE